MFECMQERERGRETIHQQSPEAMVQAASHQPHTMTLGMPRVFKEVFRFEPGIFPCETCPTECYI